MRGALAAGVSVLLFATAAAAQKGPFGLGEDLRLDGIVQPDATAKAQALGTIKIRAGSVVRELAVIRAQTSRTEGMSLFNRSELRPEQLLLRADNVMLDVFRNAPAGTRLNMLGRYMQDDYVLASITPVGASSTPGATPGN